MFAFRNNIRAWLDKANQPQYTTKCNGCGCIMHWGDLTGPLNHTCPPITEQRVREIVREEMRN